MRSWPVLLFLALLAGGSLGAQDAPAAVQVLGYEGSVAILRAGAVDWDPAYTNQVMRPGDRGRTGPNSRALLRLRDLSVVPIGERSEWLVEEPPPAARPSAIFTLLKGIAYFFHRGKPADVEFRSKTAVAAIRGTEFNFAVDENGRTVVTMLEGAVELRNEAGTVQLASGEQGIAEPGQRPTKTAVIHAINLIQWALYYPGVLDVSELPLTADEAERLRGSLTAYAAGDLLAALEQYPFAEPPASAAEAVYRAALVLAVGQVAEAERLLESLPPRSGDPTREQRLGAALNLLVAAVKHQPRPAASLGLAPGRRLATEWLAESYHLQSQAELPAARNAARRATEVSPAFGFAWARAAELEFAFGRVRPAQRALRQALRHTPRHAQAVALRGFFQCADNRIGAALRSFDEAIALDSGLGTAWLGRGLCRIRRGEAEAGRDDLLVAAALEPQRALYRSYLGKAFSHAGDNRRAAHELEIARELDPRDPTAWLYSALVNEQRNRINEAVRDLERSQDLNDQRRLYRSRLLLDQDASVRGANLARIYQDAGMEAVSVREAARAVSADYANYSAHLFLANSYNSLRDPRQVNLRYETPWLSEYLVANLLAPVGAGILSPQVTQQEYARLFEANRLGLVSSTEYFSNGDWIQNASQYGRYGSSAYAVDLSYRSENGQRFNNDLDQLSLSVRLKHQVTSRDHAYFQAVYYDADAGDLTPYYDPAEANLGLRVRERQEPLLLAGWHHEWSPGHHTLVLAGRLQDRLEVVNPAQSTLLLTKASPTEIVRVRPLWLEQHYRSDTTIYTAEAQQIAQLNRHTFVAGVRYQAGDFDTGNQHGAPTYTPDLGFPLTNILTQQLNALGGQTVHPGFERVSVYGYTHWRLLDPLRVVAGLAYDWIEFPRNFRYAPLAAEEESTDQVSPKAGVIWTPARHTTVRGAYAQSLGGVSFDQSFQLEPSQVAGFNQAWRSLIPDSVGGAQAAPKFETWGVSLERQFGRRTYLGLAGEWLESEVERSLGVYDLITPFISRSQTREALDYRERSLRVTLNQLIGNHWSLGAAYRLTEAELTSEFAGIPPSADFTFGTAQRNEWEALLHQVRLQARFHHRSGFFGSFESLWNHQRNRGYTPERPGDDFWQFNVFAGYRFPRRQAELRLGVLNLTDQDYRLNPLNLTSYLPRNRTLTVGFKFNL